MSYSIEALTSVCYEGTSCLINKFDIRDQSVLDEFEAAITMAKAAELEQRPIDGHFDFAHYKAIHKYLFDEIYDWAGQIRTVNFSKKGTVFAKAEDIEDLAEKTFSRLKHMNYFRDFPRKEFSENIVDFYCATNILHPFREGNGRTQRAFLTQLIRNAGYDINFSGIDRDDLMIATIQAAHGVTDFSTTIFNNSII